MDKDLKLPLNKEASDYHSFFLTQTSINDNVDKANKSKQDRETEADTKKPTPLTGGSDESDRTGDFIRQTPSLQNEYLTQEIRDSTTDNNQEPTLSDEQNGFETNSVADNSGRKLDKRDGVHADISGTEISLSQHLNGSKSNPEPFDMSEVGTERSDLEKDKYTKQSDCNESKPQEYKLENYTKDTENDWNNFSQNMDINDNTRDETNDSFNDSNIYFTGRLPSLINDNNNDEVDDRSDDLEYYFDERNRDTQDISRSDPRKSRVPTASKQVKDLLNKMHEPIEQPRGYSRGNQLTPSTMLRKVKSASSIKSERTKIIDPIEEVERENKSDNQNVGDLMTVDDINSVTNKLLYTINVENHNAKFDELPQMKNISEYLSSTIDSSVTSKGNQGEIKMVVESADKRSETIRVPPKLDIKENEEEHNNNDTHERQTDESVVEDDVSLKETKKNTSEASDTDLTYSEHENLSLVAGIKPVSKKTRALVRHKVHFGSQNQPANQVESSSSLICSRCLHVVKDIHKSGYCTKCRKYLCGVCITVHLVDGNSSNHQISPFYCKNELLTKQYVQATAHCTDCNIFLCMNCAIQHTKLRASRRHRIEYSSFVSKPNSRKQDTTDFLNEVQDKLMGSSTEEAKAESVETKRRRVLKDMQDVNPYRFRFSHVSDTIYPGPKKKLGTSYVRRPKWQHSSIPALPYLVQPKFMKERFSYSKHLELRRRKGKEISYMSERIKVLQARYSMKADYEMLFDKKDRALAKIKTGSSTESFSVTEVEKGINPVKRHVKQIAGELKAATGLRKCDFVSSHQLTLPAATREKPTYILAMTALPNGSLVIIDQNNNNIKIYNKQFNCRAALQFQNRLVDLCASNICPTDLYVATPKHIYEISCEHGVDVRRKIKVEIKRIEGITYWAYGIAVISKKSMISWDIRLLDYRGNQKSALEIFNPLTCEIANSQLYHVATSKGGRRISISDTKNFCVITVDVTSRDVRYETYLGPGVEPMHITSDKDHNVFVVSKSKVYQISKKGKVKGIILDKEKDDKDIGATVCSKSSDRLYVQTGRDRVSVYQLV